MLNFKNFLDRNKPILVVGGLTLVIFLVITFVSSKRETKGPTLNEVREDKTFIVEPEKDIEVDDSIDSFEELDAYVEENAEEIYDSALGITLIEFTANGFEPKNARGVQGQILRFVNKTKDTIYLKQRLKGYTELATPVEIEAGKAYEMRLTKDILWGYEETTSGAVGSIYVFKPDFSE